MQLAQKTADAVVAEAKDQAQAIVSSAEADAKRMESESKEQIEANVKRLESSRSQLQTEILELTNLLEKERDELAGSLAHLAEWVRSHLASEKLQAIALGSNLIAGSADDEELIESDGLNGIPAINSSQLFS